ncbi:unnamed protein product [Porites lobata]|uniref:Uncharacterized protein n=1 Tax=Porites lobata TaxID=104759 RepID=A0ABN8PNF9_9CNID|nr:unnamed protein product [Porites lobata]
MESMVPLMLVLSFFIIKAYGSSFVEVKQTVTDDTIQGDFADEDDVVLKAVHSTTSESAFIESGSGSGSASGRNNGYPSPDEDDSNEEQILRRDEGDSDEQSVLQEREDANEKITDYPAN